MIDELENVAYPKAPPFILFEGLRNITKTMNWVSKSLRVISPAGWVLLYRGEEHFSLKTVRVNLLEPTGYVMHQQFNH